MPVLAKSRTLRVTTVSSCVLCGCRDDADRAEHAVAARADSARASSSQSIDYVERDGQTRPSKRGTTSSSIHSSNSMSTRGHRATANAVLQFRKRHDADGESSRVVRLNPVRDARSGRGRILSEMTLVSSSHFTTSFSSKNLASKRHVASGGQRSKSMLEAPVFLRSLDEPRHRGPLDPSAGPRSGRDRRPRRPLPCTVTSCGSPSRALRTTSEKRAWHPEASKYLQSLDMS